MSQIKDKARRTAKSANIRNGVIKALAQKGIQVSWDNVIACPYCGTTFKRRTPKKKYCSPQCRPKLTPAELKENEHLRTVAQRRNAKNKAIDYKGGSCIKCGYNKSNAALEFHHRDSSTKDFVVSANGLARAWSTVKAELDKCDLLCANCHREVHYEMEQQKNFAE